MPNLVQDAGTVTYNQIFAGNEVAPMIKGVKLKTGQGILKRGSVVGLITESGLSLLVDKAATDGSQKAVGVLADDVDTTAEGEETSVLAQMYITGVFDGEALIFAEGTTISDYEKELRTLGIYTKTVQD